MNICKRGLSVCILVSVNELHIRVLPGQDVISAQPGQVFRHDTVDFAIFDVINHALESGTVVVRTTPAVIDILLDHSKTMLLSVLPQHHSLCLNAATLTLQLIVTAQSHVERGPVNLRIARLFHAKNLLKWKQPTLMQYSLNTSIA